MHLYYLQSDYIHLSDYDFRLGGSLFSLSDWNWSDGHSDRRQLSDMVFECIGAENGGIETMKSPCKDCEKRYIGCHADCEDYFNFTNEIKKIKMKKFEEKEVSDTIFKIKKTRRKK